MVLSQIGRRKVGFRPRSATFYNTSDGWKNPKIDDKIWKWPTTGLEVFFVSEFFTKLFWTVPYFIHIIMVFIPLFLKETNLFYPDKLKSVSLSVHYLYLIRFRPILFCSVLFQVLYSLSVEVYSTIIDSIISFLLP